jgi:hypothetical protein
MITWNKTIFLIPLIIAVTSFALFIVALLNGWMREVPDINANSENLIKQPLNTWISFGFIAVGLRIAWLLMQGKFEQNKNRFTQSNFTPIFFSSLIVLIGPAAMSFHATLTHIGSQLDMLSIYCIVAFMIAYAMQRFFSWKPLSFAVIFFLVVILSEGLASYLHRISLSIQGGQIAIAFFITTAVILEILNLFIKKLQHQIKWFFYALVAFIPAFVIFRFCKYDNPLCGTLSPIQGHAVWQLLAMLSLFFLFRFYVSEKPIPSQN